ncbi:MAG: glycosyltransferase [Pseudomonadota bacterium]
MTENTPSQGPLSHNVIVCVHNGLDDVKRCLTALRDHWAGAGLQKLLIVDDCSGEETRSFLDDFCSAFGPADLIRLDQQHFYTKAANRGLRFSQASLHTLLNSDTVVTAGWANSIRRIFDVDPNVGIAGPMSNAASTQSLPHVKSNDGQTAINHLPTGMGPDHFARAVRGLAAGLTIPYVPVIHGFCYTIHQKVIDRIGLLDEETFPTGYGEENDYSFRCEDAGFVLAIALDSFVYHAKSRSYSKDQQQSFTKKGQKALEKKHSVRRIQNAIATMEAQPSLSALREKVLAYWPEHDFLKVTAAESAE